MIVNAPPSQVLVRKIGRESTTEIHPFVADKGYCWDIRIMRTYCCYWGNGNKTKIFR